MLTTVTPRELIRLYVMPEPTGEVMVIVPVGVAHVGCEVTEATGWEGAVLSVTTTTFETGTLQVPLPLIAAYVPV